jgi:hypothetical protein
MRAARILAPILLLGAIATSASAGELAYRPRDSFELSHKPISLSEQASITGDDVRNRTISKAGAINFETGLLFHNHFFANNEIKYSTGQGQITQFGIEGGLIGQTGNFVGSAGLALTANPNTGIGTTTEGRLNVTYRQQNNPTSATMPAQFSPWASMASDFSKGKGQFYEMGVTRYLEPIQFGPFTAQPVLGGSFGFNQHYFQDASTGSTLTGRARLDMHLGNSDMTISPGLDVRIAIAEKERNAIMPGLYFKARF